MKGWRRMDTYNTIQHKYEYYYSGINPVDFRDRTFSYEVMIHEVMYSKITLVLV